MTKEEFEKVLDRKASVASKTKLVDWESKKNQWLRHLAEFHSEVEGYLAPYLAKGKLKAERYRVTINEENIGAYEADAMLVEIGPEKVTLVPIGTLLFGASGRVDMTGSRGAVKFILTGKESNGVRISVSVAVAGQPTKHPAVLNRGPAADEELVWKIATPPPRIQFVPLNEGTFFSSLTEVING